MSSALSQCRNLKLTDVAQKSLDGPFSVLRVQGPTCVQSVVRDMLKITCRLQPTGFACRPPRAASASYPQATVVVARVERLSREGPSREAFCVHFALQHCACLQAFPCKLLGCMSRRRCSGLCYAAASSCSSPWDCIQDKFGEHALSFACGGDRVNPHKRLRMLTRSGTQRAHTASLAPCLKNRALCKP